MAFPLWSIIKDKVSNPDFIKQLLKSLGKRAEDETDAASETVI